MLVTVAAFLAAIVVATMAGGLVGRRIRVERERRSGREGTPGASARSGARAMSSVVTTVARPSAAPGPDPLAQRASSPSGGPLAAPPPRAAPVVDRGNPAMAWGGVLTTDQIMRRLAGAPPAVATRRPSSMSPALAARQGQPIYAGARMPADGPGDRSAPLGAGAWTGAAAGRATRRTARRRGGAGRRATLALAGLGGAVVLLLAVAAGWLRPLPSGAVLETTATPAGSGIQGGASESMLPGSPSSIGVEGQSPGPVGPMVTSPPGGGEPGTGPGGGVSTPGPGAVGGPTPGATPTNAPVPRGAPTSPPTPVPAPNSTPTPAPRPTASPTPRPTRTPTPAPTPTPTLKAPSVAFTFSVSDLEASFTNRTKGAESWTWSFGDGATSSARNPSHTYAAAGSYDVTLTATGGNGASSTVTHRVTVGS